MSRIIKQKLKLNGLHCPSCALSIDFGLEDLKGVIKTDTNYAKSELVVEFDEELISLQKIITWLAEQGYQVKFN